MKKILFLMLFIFCSFFGKGQITFNKTYDNYIDGIFNVNEIPGGYYSAMIALVPFTYRRVIFIKTNLMGDTIFQKVYADSTDAPVYFSFFQTSDTNFIAGSYDVDVPNQSLHLSLFKTNLNGDSLWKKNINSPPGYSYYGNYVIETSDHGFLIAGEIADTALNDGNAFILKADSAGNEIWHNDFGGALFDAFYSSVETPDKGFLCLGWTRSFGFGNNNNHDIYLVKVDSLGNFQWQKTYGNSNSESGVGIVTLQDGNYLLSGSNYILSQDTAYAAIYKIDINGNIIWQKDYGDAQYSDLWWAREVSYTGDIVGAGSRSRSNLVDDGWVFLTDSSGNMIWERAYRKHNDYSYFRDVQPTSDSGFICAGFVFTGDFGNQDGWLVKLNSNGCLAANCGVLTTDIEETETQFKSKDISVFPNPVKDFFFVKYNVPLDDYFSVTIYNSIGQQVLQKGFPNSLSYTFPVSIKTLPNGLYFVRVGNEKHWETVKLIK
jgi:hypothetical protein